MFIYITIFKYSNVKHSPVYLSPHGFYLEKFKNISNEYTKTPPKVGFCSNLISIEGQTPTFLTSTRLDSGCLEPFPSVLPQLFRFLHLLVLGQPCRAYLPIFL